MNIDEFSDLNSNSIEQQRKRFSSQVVSDGSIFSNKPRRVKKRASRKNTKSNGSSILRTIFGDESSDAKNKNVRQTGKL